MGKYKVAQAARTAIMVGALTALAGCGVFGGGSKKKGPSTLGERISVLDYERQVSAETELSGVPVRLPAAIINASWTQPGGSASGVMEHLVLSDNPQRVWSVSIGQGSNATRRLNAVPVVEGGLVYTMDTEGRVSAFDTRSGARSWQHQIRMKGEDTRPAFGGGVSLGDGRVYATTGYGIVVALDAGTGNEIWSRNLGTPLRAAPAVDGGRIYVTSQDSQLSALDGATGETLWQANATVEPTTIMGPGAPAIAQDTVVAGFPSGELFALRVENGRTVWQDQLSRTGRSTALGTLAGIIASPVIDRGRAFVIGHGGRMVAMELATGQRVWEREFAGVSTPWPVGDWVFVVTVESQLVALTRSDGKVRWATYLGNYKNEKKKAKQIEWYGPVLAGDRLWLVSSAKEMVAVNPQDGEIASRRKLGAAAYLPPVVANAALYLLTDDGKLTAYK